MLSFLRDCRTATRRFEQARGSALPLLARLAWGVHWLWCADCRRYAWQSRLIEQLVRHRSFPGAVAMPDENRSGAVNRNATARYAQK